MSRVVVGRQKRLLPSDVYVFVTIQGSAAKIRDKLILLLVQSSEVKAGGAIGIINGLIRILRICFL